jgi:hypothetical protein
VTTSTFSDVAERCEEGKPRVLMEGAASRKGGPIANSNKLRKMPPAILRRSLDSRQLLVPMQRKV